MRKYYYRRKEILPKLKNKIGGNQNRIMLFNYGEIYQDTKHLWCIKRSTKICIYFSKANIKNKPLVFS